MKKILLLFLAAVFLTACGAGNHAMPPAGTGSEGASLPSGEIQTAEREFFAMNTYMTLSCSGVRAEEAADAAVSEIKRLDKLLSTEDPESSVAQINRDKERDPEEEIRVLTEEALKIYKETDGAFDITVYPLMVLWGFPSGSLHVPDTDELQEILPEIGSDRLSYENGHLRLSGKQEIDFGGIAKGYASDRLTEIFSEYGLISAIVSLGGNVQFYGAKPDGSLWKCGIKDPNHPDDPGQYAGILKTEDCSVITSGAYERYLTAEDGSVYHHILDPKTGFPADSGMKSVTIVSKSGILADALSTACYVMGPEKSIGFWKTSGEDFGMIFLTEEDEIYVTEDLAKNFSSDYPINIVRKE